MSLESRIAALESGVIGMFLPSSGLCGRNGYNSLEGDLKFGLCVVLSSFPRYRGKHDCDDTADFYARLGLHSDLSDRDVLLRVVEIARGEGFSEPELAMLRLVTRQQIRVQKEDDASWVNAVNTPNGKTPSHPQEYDGV